MKRGTNDATHQHLETVLSAAAVNTWRYENPELTIESDHEIATIEKVENMTRRSANRAASAFRLAVQSGGLGVSKICFTSRHMGAVLASIHSDFDLYGWSRHKLFSDCGFRRLPKKVKWDGEAHVVWVSGHQLLEPATVRYILDFTKADTMQMKPTSDCRDLFGSHCSELF